MYSCACFSLVLDLHRSPPKDLSLPRASGDAPIPLGSFRSCSTPKRPVLMVDIKCAWNLQFQHIYVFTCFHIPEERNEHSWRVHNLAMYNGKMVCWHWSSCSMWRCTTETSFEQMQGDFRQGGTVTWRAKQQHHVTALSAPTPTATGRVGLTALATLKPSAGRGRRGFQRLQKTKNFVWRSTCEPTSVYFQPLIQKY